jgi:site-specific DNA-adenine methylase
MSKYGIPYMGSKAKIISSIALNFPASENFYDLFGGGFSVTHYMLERKAKRYHNFHYNEIYADIVGLVKRAIAGEFNYNVFKPVWISREDFFRLKDNDAYVRCIWSFGNGQKSYLFGEEIEQYKKSMHQAVVFDEFDENMQKIFGLNRWPRSMEIKEKRLYLKEIKRKIGKRVDLRQLEQLERLEQLQRLQQLEQLERLQQLERLEQLERLHFYSSDYREVPIKENAIVYCDIPYKGTADYLGTFDHQAFYDWAATRDFPVYVSEYSLDDPRFKLIYSVDKRSMLSQDKSVGNKSENLYWNGVSIKLKEPSPHVFADGSVQFDSGEV